MPLLATAPEYCATLDAIAAGSAAVLNKVLGRFAALRRLASLLELSGLTISLPNPANLIPVGLIDLGKYQELVAACPGLLPPYTGANLDTLKATVSDAYTGLLDNALNHPFDRMSRLQGVIQGEISAAADAVSARIGPGLDTLSCVRNLCGAAASVSNSVLLDPTAISRAKQAFNDGVVLDPNVLTAAQQTLADKATAVEDAMRQLLAG